MLRPPGAAGSISTFSLFQGVPSNLKAGSGMCLPLRAMTLQYKDAVRYIWLQEAD